jgi:hypothetical protein
MYEGYINSVVPDIREKTLSLMKKNLARLMQELEFVCLERQTLNLDMHVWMYVCLPFMNGLNPSHT